MKEYIFNIIGTGLDNYYQVDIEILKNNKIISKGKTYNGKYKVCLKSNSIYKIKINNCTYIIYTNQENIYINLNNIILKRFILTDRNYIGLPIKKGVIILWQNK